MDESRVRELAGIVTESEEIFEINDLLHTGLKNGLKEAHPNASDKEIDEMITHVQAAIHKASKEAHKVKPMHHKSSSSKPKKKHWWSK